MTELERTTIDFLILADRVEAVNGKLYMMGGAWDQLNVANFQAPVMMSLALAVMVPWNETNETHEMELYIETEDGVPLEPRIHGKLNTGRPPTAVKGQSFRSIVAVNGIWVFPGPGTYRVVASLGNGETKKVCLYASSTGVPTIA